MRKMTLTMVLLIMILVALWFFGVMFYSTNAPKAANDESLPANVQSAEATTGSAQ